MKCPWVRNIPYCGSGTAKGKINFVNPQKDYLLYYVQGELLSTHFVNIYEAFFKN